MVNGSGGLVSRQTYYPFGAPRPTEWNPLPTDYTYTGQKLDASVNLMYYGARYYDAALGRFIQPDTITQDRTNPQGLNRYSYTLNNPLKYVDQSGHCWGWASGMRSLPNYSTVCPSIDLALSIVQHPNATPQQKIGAGAYLVLEGGAHAVLAAGTAVVTWEGIAAAGAAGAVAETGTTVTAAACGDGDCTNEATAALRLSERIVGKLAEVSTKNLTSGEVVLGPFNKGQGYTALGEARGASYLNMPDYLWKGFQYFQAEFRLINARFLDNAIQAGKTFTLQTPLEKIVEETQSTVYWEVQYILQRGYHLLQTAGSYDQLVPD